MPNDSPLLGFFYLLCFAVVLIGAIVSVCIATWVVLKIKGWL